MDLIVHPEAVLSVAAVFAIGHGVPAARDDAELGEASEHHLDVGLGRGGPGQQDACAREHGAAQQQLVLYHSFPPASFLEPFQV
jgi:hypothetical protein